MPNKRLPTSAKLRAIQWWQEEANFHPLTCGNDSNHTLVGGINHDCDVYLECPECDYVQGYVPDTVYEVYLRVGVGTSFLAQ